ncbi:hypothetical protein [uncultured Winogradskyella sp.]|uniref:hypothetical protein n=1 Tax=uncultured Winogradskyella sp. TaxID=395353 RepID=UPI00262EC64F|nr:hypothetical protein [uncultured Winogradskyella sp.]
MGEFFLEFLAGFITEALPQLIKFFGACIRWLFYLGRKKLNVILTEDWNLRVGFITLVIIIIIIINSFK